LGTNELAEGLLFRIKPIAANNRDSLLAELRYSANNKQ